MTDEQAAFTKEYIKMPHTCAKEIITTEQYICAQTSININKKYAQQNTFTWYQKVLSKYHMLYSAFLDAQKHTNNVAATPEHK